MKEITFQQRSKTEVLESYSKLKERYRKVEFHARLYCGMMSGYFLVA